MCYMSRVTPETTIGVRELRQHASRYLELVRRGHTVLVTVRGTAVARLVPVPSPDAGTQVRREAALRWLLDRDPAAFEEAIKVHDSGEAWR